MARMLVIGKSGIARKTNSVKKEASWTLLCLYSHRKKLVSSGIIIEWFGYIFICIR